MSPYFYHVERRFFFHPAPQGVFSQMELTTGLAVPWDELRPDALRESVMGIHNIVFGQVRLWDF